MFVRARYYGQKVENGCIPMHWQIERLAWGPTSLFDDLVSATSASEWRFNISDVLRTGAFKKTVRPTILFPRTLRKNKRNGVLFMSNRHIFHFRETAHSTPLAVGLNSVWSTTTPTYVSDAIAVIFSDYFFLTTKTPSSARKYLKKAFCSVRFTTHSCILN